MWETLIGSLGTLFGVVITYLTFVKGRDKEIRTEAMRDATIETQLRNIDTGVIEIRSSIQATDEKVNKMHNDLIRIDENAKSAHKRIDNIVRKRSEEHTSELQ